MKKITKIAALLTAGALLFGGMFLSCSDSDDENTSGGSGTTNGGQVTPTPTPDPVPGDDTDKTLSGWWSLDGYISSLNIPASTADLSENTVAGPVTILSPAKWTSTGEFEIEGSKRAGYVQLGIPDSGTEGTKKGLQFTVPKTATKIVVYGKNDENLAIIKQGETKGIEKYNADAANNYAAFSWDINATEDTVYTVYHNKQGSKATINLKAIYVEVPGVALSSIAVTAQPTKTEYAIGAALDTTGLEVTATYTNDKSKVVTGWTVSEFDSTTAGEKELTVTYKEGDVEKTATFKVTVKAKTLASISVKTNPIKTEYLVGDSVDLTGLVITLTYDDASTEDVTYASANAADFSTDFTSSAAAESKEVTVTYKEKTAKFTVKITAATYFTKFDAKDLYVNADGTAATGDVNVTENKAAADGSWNLVIASSKKAQVKAGEFKTYDYDEATSKGYKWTNRLSFNKQGADNVALKLKVGAAKQVILRVDGGSVKDLSSNATGESNLTFKGAGDAISWNPVVSLSTAYVTVTGDADGYVTINSTDTTNGANIYGITVVSEAVDTSKIELPTKLTTAAVYSKPVIAEGYTATATQGDTLTATATLTQPTKSTATPVYADGSLGTAVEGTESVDGSAVTWTTAYGENVLTLGTGLSLAYATSATATDTNYVPAGTYSVTASYKISETAYTSDPISVQVKEAGATYVTVTFNANGGTAGTVTTQDVASEAATALKTVAELGLTAPSGKTFAGWALSTDATEAVYTDGANITVNAATTLYAVYIVPAGPISYGKVTFNSSLSNTADSYVTIAYDESYAAQYKDYKSTLDGSSTASTAEGYLAKGLKVNGNIKVIFTFKQKTECTLYLLQNNTQGHGFTFTNSDDNTKSYTCAYSTNTDGSGVKAITFTLEAGTYSFARDGSSSKEYALGGIVFTSAN